MISSRHFNWPYLPYVTPTVSKQLKKTAIFLCTLSFRLLIYKVHQKGLVACSGCKCVSLVEVVAAKRVSSKGVFTISVTH